MGGEWLRQERGQQMIPASFVFVTFLWYAMLSASSFVQHL